MEVKCEYCGSMIPDDATHCPNCGGPNDNFRRAAEGTPKTIEELQEWYRARNLPPYSVTRFFIGEDCREPKAFGIYRDGDRFVVYKNKADGSRSVRYDGKDEDYAVNELFLKLKSEILNQKEHRFQKRKTAAGGGTENTQERANDAKWVSPARKGTGRKGTMSMLKIIMLFAGLFFAAILLIRLFSSGLSLLILAAIIAAVIIFAKILLSNSRGKKIFFILLAVVIAVSVIVSISGHSPKYYNYMGIPYVWYNDDWYRYDDDLGGYTETYEEIPFDANDPDYQADTYTDFGDSGNYNFQDSSYYSSSWSDTIDFSSSSDNDYDWSSSWDSDWDSDWSDWDSDW